MRRFYAQNFIIIGSYSQELSCKRPDTLTDSTVYFLSTQKTWNRKMGETRHEDLSDIFGAQIIPSISTPVLLFHRKTMPFLIPK